MKFIVDGDRLLSGSISVSGSKNSALAALAGCILSSDPVEILNVPDILDVRNFLKILEHLGAGVRFGGHRASIDPRRMRSDTVPAGLASRLRGSILLAGPLLARFGHTTVPRAGGDAIGKRPIDAHLEGFRKLGATVSADESVRISGRLSGCKIVMPISSVTGTENLLMAAVLAEGDTEIHMAACEPHVQDLCRMLCAMGAQIKGIGSPTLLVSGVRKLSGTSFTIGSDEIEAITLIALAAATKSEMEIKGVNLSNLEAPLEAFERMNVRFSSGASTIRIHKPNEPYRATKITTGVFPQLLTDEQPLFGVLATQAVGTTEIHDWIYEGRQGYLLALEKMGARVMVEDKNHATITGPSPLVGAEILTPDLRAGASILTGALVAKGRSVIYTAEIIDRGYERLDERLNALGASIKRVE